MSKRRGQSKIPLIKHHTGQLVHSDQTAQPLLLAKLTPQLPFSLQSGSLQVGIALLVVVEDVRQAVQDYLYLLFICICWLV